MNRATVIFDDETNASVAAIVVDITNGWEAEVAQLCFQKNRVVVVDSHGLVVHIPKDMRAVGLNVYHDCLGVRRIAWGNGIVWHGQ